MGTKLCPYCAEEIQEAAIKCKHCGSSLVEPPQPVYEPPVRIARSRRDQMLGGVCSGIAHYFGIDPTIVRVLTILVAVPTMGTAILVYVALWIIMPMDDE